MIPGATTMADGKVGIWNVRDAEGFVGDTIRKSRLRLGRDEHDELLAEGITILCELAAAWKPRLDGYQQDGTFSGFAGYFLPRRLQDAYYRMHPEHQLRRSPDGERVREFGHAPLSLDGDEMAEPVASVYLGPHPYDVLPYCPTVALASMPYEPSPGVARAITTLPPETRIIAHGIVKAIDEGFAGTDEIAQRMRLNRSEVTRAKNAIGSAVYAQINREVA